MNPTKVLQICNLQSEGDKPKMDSQKFVCPNSNNVQMDNNETVSQKSSERNDLDLIDIESLFDENTDDTTI